MNLLQWTKINGLLAEPEGCDDDYHQSRESRSGVLGNDSRDRTEKARLTLPGRKAELHE